MVRPKKATPNAVAASLKLAKSFSGSTHAHTNAEAFSAGANKRKRTTSKQTDADEPDTSLNHGNAAEREAPPRQRRMASLNAEFLVHYCSSTNTQNMAAQNQTNGGATRRQDSATHLNGHQTHTNSNAKRKSTARKSEGPQNTSAHVDSALGNKAQ